MSAAEQEIAAIKARWAAAPRTWEQAAALVAQAPHDIRTLLEVVDRGGVEQQALAVRFRQLQQENEGLRLALGFTAPPTLDVEAPALKGPTSE